MSRRHPQPITLRLPGEDPQRNTRQRCAVLGAIVQGCIAGVILTPPAWAVWQFFQP